MPTIARTSSARRGVWTALLFVIAATAAQAHPSIAHATDAGSGLTAGFLHPFSGIDHLLAMIAVGLWGAQLGGRSRWLVPAAFVGAMALGGLLAAGGLVLPGIESGIAVSLVVLGIVVTASLRMSPAAGMMIVGAMALLHGQAHGAELPAGASAMPYVAGFVLATIALHAVGLALGTVARRRAVPAVVRWAGAAVAVAGIVIICS